MSQEKDANQRNDWAAARAHALRYACARTRCRQKGEELAAEALAAAVDPDRQPWDRAKEPDLSRHLLGVVNSILSGARKKARLRQDRHYQEALHDLSLRPAPVPDERLLALAEERRSAHRWAALRVAVATQDRAPELVDLYEQGIDGAAEQAEALGLPLRRVYKLRHHVMRCARALPRHGADG